MNKSLRVIISILITLTASQNTWGAVSGDQDQGNAVLGIFGNANMDYTIDEKDRVQIEQTIHGEDKELTIIDSANNAVTINKPVKKVVIGSSYYGEALLYMALRYFLWLT